MTAAAARARGTLFLVVGPSGAGKDTLLAVAKEALADDPAYVFPRRIVTRPRDRNEDNVAVNERQFAELHAAGAFALAWDAHGHRYGVPADVTDDLAAGRHVVVNVSRTVIAEARERFAPVAVVAIAAPAAVLADRLRARGREGAGAIDARLARQEPVPEGGGVRTVTNDADIATGAARLLNALRSADTR
ncbi:MAG: phosphonate metabolism protein/1,5-bisphosphokinase (PRPP-forming) PhnN [Alphaproteobacteria bacterium]|nr:phosphonate metabolism protein/1,5-bisphosphokinase (PRPP-forming) PhnN [Alphaproteobacteria bacterium]